VAAAECLALAGIAVDPVMRVRLVNLAEKWQRLVEAPRVDFDAIVQNFNDRRMDGH